MSARTSFARHAAQSSIGTAFLLGIVLASSSAAAQQSDAPAAAASGSPAPQATADEARRQFEIGVEALRDERYTDALAAFRASYAARPAASVALNLGITLRALGRLVEAREFLQEFLRGASATQHTEHDSLVQGYLLDVNRRIGVLHVEGSLPADTTLTLDGHRVVLDASSNTPIDPGDHTFIARAHGFRASRNEVHVDAGARVGVQVALEASASVVSSAPPVLSEPHAAQPVAASPPAWRSPILWTVVGVVVAAAIVVPIVVVSTSGYNDPAGTSTGVIIQGLHQ